MGGPLRQPELAVNTDPTHLPPEDTAPRALCVDLDGTLITTDATGESIVAYIKLHPFRACIELPCWLIQGRGVLKRRLAERVSPDPALFPYRESVLEYIRQQKQEKRRIVLATASDQSIAQAVADHVGLFDDTIGSSQDRNTKGRMKITAIEQLLGNQPYDYIGDSRADLPLWQATGKAIMVNPSHRTQQAAQRHVNQVETLVPHRSAWASIGSAMRPHQWVKNLLLAVPLLAGHQINPGNIARVMAAMIAFSLCASAIYLINDMMDIDADRRHPRKRNRALASGALSLAKAAILAPLLLATGALIAIFVSQQFIVALAVYLTLAGTYSLWLKSKLMVDVIVLAGLYSLRIYAGGMAVGINLSHWLLLFSMFFFLSLAFVKRYTELRLVEQHEGSAAIGRGYLVDDIEMLRVFGPVCGYLSVLIFAMYIDSADVIRLYGHGQRLWAICPVLLYWISRVWLVALRGRLHHDPVVFATTDYHSYLAGGITVAIILSAA